MIKSKRAMRRVILSRLFDTLQEHYPVEFTKEWFSSLSPHEVDAILSFKSGPTLEELRQALDRLEDGTFGVCISCKEEIGQKVLDSDPARRICFDCENALSHHVYASAASHLTA